MTPMPSLSRLEEEAVTPPVADVSPDPFRETEEAVVRTVNRICAELQQYVAGGERAEFMESMETDVKPELRYLAIPATLQYLLKDVSDGRRELARVVDLLGAVVAQHGLCDSLRKALDRFRDDFCNAYGEDAPAFSAEIAGQVFAALVARAHDDDGAHDVLHAVLSCLAQIADTDPYWNAPSRTARSAGFAATVLAELLRATVAAQRAAGAPDPHAAVRAMLDREAVDVRALFPLTADAALERTRLADLLRHYELAPLLPAFTDPALVLAPLAAPAMVPLTPAKLAAWLRAPDRPAQPDAYYALLVAEHVFDTLKAEATAQADADADAAALLDPWVATLQQLPQPEHFQVGLLTLMSRHWSATSMREGTLRAMARTARAGNLVTKPAFDRWRQDTSDGNSTLKDQAFAELQDLFDDN